jgi:hypothetical protein
MTHYTVTQTSVVRKVEVLLLLLFAVRAGAQCTVTFDNRSGQAALVKLVGPRTTDVSVDDGKKQR